MFEKVDTSTPLGRVQMFRLRQSVNRYEISILTAYFCVTVHTNLATPFLSVLCNKDFFSPQQSRSVTPQPATIISQHTKRPFDMRLLLSFKRTLQGNSLIKIVSCVLLNYMQTASECFFQSVYFF